MNQRVFPVLWGLHSLDLGAGFCEFTESRHTGDQIRFHDLMLLARV